VAEAVPERMPQLTIERLNFAPSPCISERTEHVPLFLSQSEQLSRTNENRSSYGPSSHTYGRPSLTTDGPFMYAPTIGGMVVLEPSVLLGHDSMASVASRGSPSQSTDSNTTAVTTEFDGRNFPQTVTPPDSNVVDTSEYFTPEELLRERHRSSSHSPPPPLNTSNSMRMDSTGCAVSFSRALDFSASNATADYDDMAAENSWLDVSKAMLPMGDEVSPRTRAVVDQEEEKENGEDVGFFNGNPTGNFTSD